MRGTEALQGRDSAEDRANLSAIERETKNRMTATTDASDGRRDAAVRQLAETPAQTGADGRREPRIESTSHQELRQLRRRTATSIGIAASERSPLRAKVYRRSREGQKAYR